jgi:hypothetical protein
MVVSFDHGIDLKKWIDHPFLPIMVVLGLGILSKNWCNLI